jgi:hypothetical protein
VALSLFSFPKKQFMERALRIRQEEGLPSLKLKEPWWGYKLGYCPTEYEEQAETAISGDHYRTGEILAEKRRPV